MSDIQRWRSEHIWGDMRHEPDGEFVTYVDHEAEIASVIVSAAEVAAEAKKEGYRYGVLDGNAYTSAKLQDFYGERAQGHYMDGYKMGYAKGLIEGDSGGRKEGYRVGYAAGKDAVMTSSYEQAVAEGEREALSKWIDGVAKGRADAAKEVAELDLASCESMIEHISRWAAVNAARGPMSEQRCVVCGDAITDWGDGDWHHVPRTDPDDYLKGHDHDVLRSAP